MSSNPIPGEAAARAAALENEAKNVGPRRGALWRDTLKGILRQRSAIIGLVVLGFFALVAIFADVIAPFGPDQSMLRLKEEGAKALAPPCIHLLGCPQELPQHLFGLDSNYRDVFSRVVYGTRISLVVGFVAVGFAILIGALLGALAGFTAGKTDNVIMRFMDILLVFPSLILAILIVTFLGANLLNAMVAIGIVAIPIYARIMRASVLTVRGQDFVTASQALGESNRGILFRRVLPNAMTPIIVAGTLGIGSAVLDIAALSFIGLAADPRIPEWGLMISLERNKVFAAPHLLIFPGVALALVVLAFNLVGDGIRDALDPRLNR
jgi:ABC-type dipeptide/oligopeptide/nickel transport system permease subunit